MQNLRVLENAPLARTNMIKLKDEPLEIIEKLLAPSSCLYAIAFEVRRFKKERKNGRMESSRDLYARIHREVKERIRSVLRLKEDHGVTYELVRLQDGRHLYFYLNSAAAPNSSAQAEVLQKTQALCESIFDERHSLGRLLEALFGLHLKIEILEQASSRFAVDPVYYNSTLYLNAHLTQSVKESSGFGVMEAYSLKLFASEQQELAFTLHRNKFLVKPGDEQRASLDNETVWFSTGFDALSTVRQLDARDSKLVFFKAASGYGECGAYSFNVVLNSVLERLEVMGVSFEEVIFQATHEVEFFATDLDDSLSNRLFVVDAGVGFSEVQRDRFLSCLKEKMPGCVWLSKEDFLKAKAEGFAGWDSGATVLVLSPVSRGDATSISLGNDSDKTFSDFFDVFSEWRKDRKQSLDLYTGLKAERLEGWLYDEPLPIVIQGMNVGAKILEALDHLTDQERLDPVKYREDISNSKSQLRKKLNSVVNKINRIKTELWFKEVLLGRKSIPGLPMKDGNYTAYFIRVTGGTAYLGYVAFGVEAQLEIEDSTEEPKSVMSIEEIGVTEGDADGWEALAAEHGALNRLANSLKKPLNGSFYLYDHTSDDLLTVYHNLRVPRIIGKADEDVVDWYVHQEKARRDAENRGEKFTDFAITRSTKDEYNVLPYYLSPGRLKNDPLKKSAKMRHHHAYLQKHDEGVFLFVSSAQAANQTIDKQRLVENLIIIKADGSSADVLSHPLADVYLNSFTLDMLRSSESSKMSIFTKLAKLMVEN